MNNQHQPTFWQRLRTSPFIYQVSPIIIAFLVGAFFVFPLLFLVFGIHGDRHTWEECTYFSVVTITTTGYGDLQPEGAGRAIACIEMLTGVFILVIWLGWVFATLSKKDAEKPWQESTTAPPEGF